MLLVAISVPETGQARAWRGMPSWPFGHWRVRCAGFRLGIPAMILKRASCKGSENLSTNCPIHYGALDKGQKSFRGPLTPVSSLKPIWKKACCIAFSPPLAWIPKERRRIPANASGRFGLVLVAAIARLCEAPNARSLSHLLLIVRESPCPESRGNLQQNPHRRVRGSRKSRPPTGATGPINPGKSRRRRPSKTVPGCAHPSMPSSWPAWKKRA